MSKRTPEDDIPEDDADLATVTQIPTAFNAESTESEETKESKPKFNFMDSTLGRYLMDKRNMQTEQAMEIGRRFGQIGLRLMGTFKSEDLSIAEKVQGVLGAGADAAGELVKASVQIGPIAGLLHAIPGEGTGKTVDAFISGAVDAATGIVAEKKNDKAGNPIYGFNELGVARFVDPKGLVTVGVEAAVGGIDAAMADVHGRTKGSTSGAAETFNNVYDIYKSPRGRAITRIATRVAKERLGRKVGTSSKAA